MRQEEFKMERTGLVQIGEVIPITEGKLPYLGKGLRDVGKFSGGKPYQVQGRKSCGY